MVTEILSTSAKVMQTYMISYRQEGPEIEPYFTRCLDHNGDMCEGGVSWEEARNEVVSWYKYMSMKYLTQAEEFRRMTEKRYFIELEDDYE